MIHAAFIFDEAHLLTSLARARRQTRGRLIFLGVKIVAALLFCAMAAVMILARQFTTSLILLVPVVFLIFAHRLDQPAIRRRFRKSPFHNAAVRWKFSDTSLEVHDSKVDARLDWSVFSRLVIFDDGLLAYQGEGVFNWFPASAFSTPADYRAAEALFRQKISVRKDLSTRSKKAVDEAPTLT